MPTPAAALRSLGLGLALAITASATLPAPAQAWESIGKPTAATAHYDLEVLYAESQFKEGERLTRQRIAQTPDDAELYWHLVRFMFENAEGIQRTDTSVDKEAIYEEMIDWADKGLALDPGHPHILFARGIARGRLGTTRGVLSSLFMAKDIEEDWTATLNSGYRYEALNGSEVLPCDAHNTLGIFYRLVPEWWIVQVIGGTRGDLDKSVAHLKSADKCSPNRIGIIKELGVAQICRGQKRKQAEDVAAGFGDLKRALALSPKTPTDTIDQDHIRKVLADPDMACEYSRDGQADLDRAKLDAASASGG